MNATPRPWKPAIDKAIKELREERERIAGLKEDVATSNGVQEVRLAWLDATLILLESMPRTGFYAC